MTQVVTSLPVRATAGTVFCCSTLPVRFEVRASPCLALRTGPHELTFYPAILSALQFSPNGAFQIFCSSLFLINVLPPLLTWCSLVYNIKASGYHVMLVAFSVLYAKRLSTDVSISSGLLPAHTAVLRAACPMSSCSLELHPPAQPCCRAPRELETQCGPKGRSLLVAHEKYVAGHLFLVTRIAIGRHFRLLLACLLLPYRKHIVIWFVS